MMPLFRKRHYRKSSNKTAWQNTSKPWASGRTDPESFRACVLLVIHEDLEPCIERIVDGDTSPILTGKSVTTLSLSSGTTQGKSKFLLFNEEMLWSTVQIYHTPFAFINRSLSNWYSMIPEIWPNVKYVYGIMIGSMEPYSKKLQHYAGNLPLLSAYYKASEGWIGANVNPRAKLESVAYAVFPNIGYFEFLRLRKKPNEKEPKNIDSTISYKELEPVGLTEVEVGKLYEVIITNFAAYVRSGRNNIIGPLELRVVSRGTFQKIMDHHADHGTTLSQFKMPRCVGPSNRKVLQILCSNVVKSYFSTAYG